EGALGRFVDGERGAGRADVVTYEFENVPARAAAWLESHVRVWPPREALETAQERVAEKTLFGACGIGVRQFRAVGTRRGGAGAGGEGGRGGGGSGGRGGVRGLGGGGGGGGGGAAGQRDGAAGAQQRALDHGRGGVRAVREPRARGVRHAAGEHGVAREHG